MFILMGYDILNNELYEGHKNNKKSKKKEKKYIKINPLYIHLGLIIIILLFLFYYFLPFDSTKEKELGNILLVGELENFNKSYNGDLNFYSGVFTLKTNDVLKGKGQDFIIENFSGQIYLKNKSIIFEGIAKKIDYNNNNINLDFKKFKLISEKKTNFNAFFKNLNLNMTEGKLKIDKSLSYSFQNGLIKISDINASINYDGTFSISGNSPKFNFKSDKQKTEIIFKNE